MKKPSRNKRSPAKRNADDGYHCHGRAWIEGKDGTFLGYGRVVLLERIRDHGSISKAAISMEMSYKHAWDLIDSMNRQAKNPLVEKVSGGRGGGGTQLTEAGEQAIDAFWSLHARLEKFLAEETKKLEF
ncbi:MAG: LysR family transcriptional regulator [Desulfobulbaceae bacterium]|nr:LysR family transcriptional regulator [Desulfobulbaceae bacterium]